MKDLRMEYGWLHPDSTTLTLGAENRVEWWTFGGTRANATLAAALRDLLMVDMKSDAFKISVGLPKTLSDVEQAVYSVNHADFSLARPKISKAAIYGLKFNKCLSCEMATQVLEDRLRDEQAAHTIASQPVAVVVTLD